MLLWIGSGYTQTYMQITFSLTHPEEEVWPGGTQPMSLLKECVVRWPPFSFWLKTILGIGYVCYKEWVS